MMRGLIFNFSLLFVIISSCLIYGPLLGGTREDSQIRDRVLLISIPKSGTFLMCKCVRALMANKNDISRLKEPSILMRDYMLPDLASIKKSLSKEKFILWGHPIYNQEQVSLFNAKASSLLFMFRDPRDQIISSYFFMKKESSQHKTRYFWDWVNHTTIDEFIFKMIADGTMVEECPEAPHGIRELYEAYEPYLKMENVCKIRFEDLVGTKGGGAKGQQEAIVQAIADNLKIVLDRRKLKAICQSLFGESSQQKKRYYSTFREGQIGSWRHYFSEEHKKAFKAAAGDLLIRWGYEKDLNW